MTVDYRNGEDGTAMARRWTTTRVANGSLEIPAGETTGTFTVRTVDDNEGETTETFTVRPVAGAGHAGRRNARQSHGYGHHCGRRHHAATLGRRDRRRGCTGDRLR